MSRFLQFHLLTSYVGTLLNRDDAGFAKVLPFGNAKRTRVSSQCLKYHWRNFKGKHAIRQAAPMSVRSRRTFRKLIAEQVATSVEGEDSHRLVAALTLVISKMVLSGETTKGKIKSNAKTVLKSEDPFGELNLKQIVVLGEKEVEYLRGVVEEILAGLLEDQSFHEQSVKDRVAAIADALGDADLQSNLRGMGNAMGLDAAMHGRMVTSDMLAIGDSAVHVAHAFTTHKQQREDDYFTAVDQLSDKETGGEESGAALIQSKELTSGVFYSYVSVDVPLLVSNLEGCSREEWREADLSLTVNVLQRFLHTITKVSPGAKRGSTAPYARAEFVLLEDGEEQPRTLANSFREAVTGEDLMQESVQQLAQYIGKIDGMYGQHEERVYGTTVAANMNSLGKESRTVDQMAEWIESQLTRQVAA